MDFKKLPKSSLLCAHMRTFNLPLQLTPPLVEKLLYLVIFFVLVVV